jgi:hypothetical protein
MLRARRWFPMALAILAAGMAPDARGGSIKITVANNQPAGGYAVAPVWFGLHDGTFDAFNAGSPASNDVVQVAELGDTGPLMTSFDGNGPQTTVLGSLPQFAPGDSSSAILDVADPTMSRFLSFAAMVVPSNDMFLANDNPTAFPIFDAGGHFLGPITIQIFGANLWDAGAEVNNITDGGAFVVGVDAHGGTVEGGAVHHAFDDPGFSAYLADIHGRMTPIGPITHDLGPGDLIATFTISAVPEPGSIALVVLGLGGLAAWRRRRTRPASA